MVKASNNNFGAISKIKIQKIGSFCNLKSAKITINVEKYFQHKFRKVQHAQNIIKITPNERGDQMHLLHIYYFWFLRMAHPSKSMLNKVIISQNMLEFKIFLNIYKKNPKNENDNKSCLSQNK